MKKVGIYDPYLDTLGGGERYCLTVAEILLKNNFDVDLFWSGSSDLIAKAEDRFNLNLGNLKIVPDIFKLVPNKLDLIEDQKVLDKIISSKNNQDNLIQKIKNFIDKYKITKEYESFFYLSDGSIPFLFSKKNFLHIQVPVVKKFSLQEKILNQIKLYFFNNIIVNSEFTKKFIEKLFNHQIDILYPPVDVDKFLAVSEKENIIISVGRFDNILNAKKQDVLIDAFKFIVENNKTKNWKLILAGGSLENPSKNSYLTYLKTKAGNLPIEFVVNPNFQTLRDLYSKSKIYWHAAGYNVDENKNPENTEHFGMTVVEAMASGLVPVVVNQGGLRETVKNDLNGFLWDSINDLISKTQLLISSPQIIQEMSIQSIKLSKQFSKENFEKKFLSLINLKI